MVRTPKTRIVERLNLFFSIFSVFSHTIKNSKSFQKVFISKAIVMTHWKDFEYESKMSTRKQMNNNSF